ncbi:MAG: heavy metal-associated domain-containing protein [Nitrososphaeraceae archaeon]
MANQKAFFKVVGMYCISCKPIVEKQLKDEKGVKSIKFDYLTDSIIVEFDPALLTKEDIKNSLDKSGYKFVRLGNRGFGN